MVVLILALLWFSSVTWFCFDCFVSVLNSVLFISSNFWDVKCVSSLWPGNQETVLYLHISTSFTSWWDYSCCSFVPTDFLLRLVLVISLSGDFLVVKSKNWSHNPFNRNQPNWVYWLLGQVCSHFRRICLCEEKRQETFFSSPTHMHPHMVESNFWTEVV